MTAIAATDRALADLHLDLLGRGLDRFTFQIWADEGNDGITPQVLTGTASEQWDRLVAANEAGAGIGVTMQETSGGRRVEDVLRYRTVFAECDSPESAAMPSPASCMPSFVVRSSPGKCHRVWLIEPTSDREGWLAAMNQVGAFYGSDPSAVDPTRVLRLAGTLHRKRGGRSLVTIEPRHAAYEDPWIFDLAAIIDAHPVDAARLAEFAVDAGGSGGGTLKPKAPDSLDPADERLLEDRLTQAVTVGRNRWAGVWICDAYLCGATPEWIRPRIESWIRAQGREPHPREVADWLKAAQRRGRDGRLFCSDHRLSPQVADEFRDPPADTGAADPSAAAALTFEPHKHHLPAADLIIAESYTDPATGRQTTVQSSTLGDFLWNGRFYGRITPQDVARRVTWRFGPLPRFRPSHADSIASAILRKRGTDAVPPCWLDGSDRGHAMVLSNGIYCIERREFIGHSPDLFATCGTAYPYKPGADCPTWLRFLDSIWAGCPRTHRELQKWFGYNLVPSYRYHKLALLVGAKRGGKGTICRILQALLGAGSYVTPCLYGLHERFALSAYVGKLAAIDPEVQFSRPLDPQSLGLLKKITGDDAVQIEEKGMPRHHGVRLRTRFTLGTNNVINFGDPSGAMVDRLLVFKFTESFTGREDYDLGDRLLRELPGILNWALAGLMHLDEDGGFRQTPLGETELAMIRHSDSPMRGWADENLIEDPWTWTATNDLFASWTSWAAEQHMELHGSMVAFGRRLGELFPKVKRIQGPRPGRLWGYQGLRLRLPGDEFQGSDTPAASASSSMAATGDESGDTQAATATASVQMVGAGAVSPDGTPDGTSVSEASGDTEAIVPAGDPTAASTSPLSSFSGKKEERGEEGKGGEGVLWGGNRENLVTWCQPQVDLPPAPHGKHLWTIDCEVFPDHVLVVASDGRNWREWTEFTLPDLATFLADPGIAIAGFNNHGYDDLILRRIAAHPDATAAEIHALSRRIILPQGPEDTQANFELQYADRPWAYSVDVFQLLNGKGSLKEWACREGFPSVAESPADFDAPLPDHLVEAVRTYCRTDVHATLLLLQRHWHLVALRTTLSEQFGLGWRVYTLSEPKLAQHTFLTLHRKRTRQGTGQVRAAAEQNPANRRREFPVAELISRRVAFDDPAFRAIGDAVRAGTVMGDADGRTWTLAAAGLDLSKPVRLAGRDFQLGVGGLHSVDGPGVFAADERIALIDLDVTSYYPSIIISEGLHPAQLGPDFVADMVTLRDRRVAAKRAGDKGTADALKIVVNATFGKLNDPWSPIRSVPDAHSVTINGQLFLLMLIERLHTAGAEIISANTDGVTVRWVRDQAEARLPAVIADWQGRTGMELERTDFVRLCRRDVNAYIALTSTGKVKSKGAFNPDSGKGDGLVVKQAVEAHLLHGTDPAAIIDAETDPTAFLFYQRAKNGGDLHHGELRLGKSARWYAATAGEPIRRRNPNGSWATIPHAHHACLAMDITGWTRADLTDLDRAHYIDEAWKLIKEITS